MSLQAGKLRHRITLQEKISEQDSDGNTVETWVEVAKLWASIEPLSAREFISAASTQSQVTARITIRARTVDASMRILHGSKIYNIAGVLTDKDSGQEYITLPCAEGTNAG